MRRWLFNFGIFFLALTMVGAPFFMAVVSQAPFLNTPRLNDQWAPIASSVPLAPGQTVTSSIESLKKNLSRIDVYMHPPHPSRAQDQYLLTLYDDSSVPIAHTVLSNAEVWDDVGHIDFDPLVDSADRTYRLELYAFESNRSVLTLATEHEQPDQLIHQPLYFDSTSPLEALLVVGSRLSWKLVPALILTLLLPFYLGILVRVYRT